MPVGSKIRKLRELKNYKQEFVAEKLGMSAAGYGKIERDETDISLSRLEQIAEVFDMSVTEMLSWDEKFVFYHSLNECQNGFIYQQHNGTTILEKEKLEMEIVSLKSEIENLKKIIGLLESK